jgi:hypothetical protein
MKRYLLAAALALAAVVPAHAEFKEEHPLGKPTSINEQCRRMEAENPNGAANNIACSELKAGRKISRLTNYDTAINATETPLPKGISCDAPGCASMRVSDAMTHAQIGSIQTPRHDRMVCDSIEDVRPANEAWLGLINRMKSVGMSPDNVHKETSPDGSVGKWLAPGKCGLIKTGKAALIRKTQVLNGVEYICVEIFANVPSAEHYASTISNCHWSPQFSNAYTEEDSPANPAPANVRNQTQPEDKVYEAYWRFALVQYCHKVRDGYAMIFVSDAEYYRSETIAKAVAQKTGGSVDTDKLWHQALEHNNGMPVSRDWCQRAYRELLELSPVGVFDMQKPE